MALLATFPLPYQHASNMKQYDVEMRGHHVQHSTCPTETRASVSPQRGQNCDMIHLAGIMHVPEPPGYPQSWVRHDVRLVGLACLRRGTTLRHIHVDNRTSPGLGPNTRNNFYLLCWTWNVVVYEMDFPSSIAFSLVSSAVTSLLAAPLTRIVVAQQHLAVSILATLDIIHLHCVELRITREIQPAEPALGGIARVQLGLGRVGARAGRAH